MKQAPKILDCTLRDGSYVVDFAFTADFTGDIAARLGKLGFPYVEVGHGIGLGASAKGMGVAAATDEEYMAEVHGWLDTPSCKWGMFAIPGIASLDDIELAASFGMEFIRIGCEVADVEGAAPFIERARSRGMYVFSNLMKSYAAPTDVFVKQALKCVSYGAQCVYIVDSAGGMLPEDIRTYAEALRQAKPDIKLGFHGHNNLGLGVANALLAAEMDFDVIDTSLQGLGRGGGNVPTEQFLAALIRSGYSVPYDAVNVMQMGEEFIRPLIRDAGISSADVAMGLAQFHSSYMPRIEAAAKRWRADKRRLIMAVAEHDKLNAPIAVVEACAERLKGTQPPSVLLTKPYYGQEQS